MCNIDYNLLQAFVDNIFTEQQILFVWKKLLEMKYIIEQVAVKFDKILAKIELTEFEIFSKSVLLSVPA